MPNALTTRAFSDDELVETPRPQPRIVCPADLVGFRGGEQELVEWVKSRKEEMFRAIHQEGGLLLRGFPTSTAQVFEDVLMALELDLEVEYRGGLSPRSNVTARTWTSTDVAAPLVIGYHTEMCYLPRRPRYVAFYCDIAPEKDGETVLFDAAAAWQGIPEATRKQLLDRKVKYRRHFAAADGDNNIHKSWKNAYGFETREEVEAFLTEERTEFEWHEDGSLSTMVTLPPMLHHSTSDSDCLSITMNDQHSLLNNFERIAERHEPKLYAETRAMLQGMLNSKNVFMQTLTGDNEPFSVELRETINRSIWESALLFKWQRGDVLLLDNIRFGHGRLNVAGPRRIVAALGNIYDVREVVPA